MWRWHLAVAAVLALATACSSGDDDSGSSPVPTGPLDGPQAEGLAVNWLNDRNYGAGDLIDEGFSPFCNARERSADGWDVQCGWIKPTDGVLAEERIDQWVTLIVADDRSVRTP